MLKLKLQYSGYLMQRTDSLENTLVLGKIEGGKRKGWQRMSWLDGITNSWSLLKLMSIDSVMPCNHLILCRPLLLLPSIFPNIRAFANGSVLCIRWPKYWSFNFTISPSNEYSGLISFRMDWLDLLAVQGTLKVFSNTTVQKHQFFSTQSSLWSNSHIHNDYWKNHSFD